MIRTIFLLASTAFSLLFVMLILNIITIDEAVEILNLSESNANAFRSIVSRVQEVSAGIIDVISQLLSKLFAWAGIDVDLSKVEVDLNQNQAPQEPVNKE